MSNVSISKDFKIKAPKMAGMDNRKEKWAASRRDMFKKRAADMVDPDLEIPGKSATPCAQPIRNAWVNEIPENRGDSATDSEVEMLRVDHNRLPVMRRPKPAAVTEPKLLSTVSSNKRPIRAVGAEAVISSRMALGLFKEATITFRKITRVAKSVAI